MDVAQIRALKPRLDSYLARFEDCFSRCDTREHLAVYVNGQLSDLAQKSVEPIALAAGIPPRTLQEFLARYRWNEDGLRQRLHHIVAREHACPRSIGLIDETSDPKKGVQTPGVQRQHCGAVGKKDNCIVTVHLGYAADQFHIDTDYDGQSFFVRHAYFLYGGKDTKEGPYDKLKKALRAEIDEGEWSKLYSATSQPFDPPKSGKIAVKVINHFGDEVLKVYPVPAPGKAK